jgi:hypothetical protein
MFHLFSSAESMEWISREDTGRENAMGLGFLEKVHEIRKEISQRPS